MFMLTSDADFMLTSDHRINAVLNAAAVQLIVGHNCRKKFCAAEQSKTAVITTMDATPEGPAHTNRRQTQHAVDGCQIMSYTERTRL
jgi:hypothetical protein